MRRLRTYLVQPLHIAPLASFRVLFGAIMFVSVLRFMLRGWVTELYVEPEFYFTYFGFDWVKPLGETGMYAVFASMAVFALGICLGLFYRLSAAGFFLTFTYVELLDKTNYLNHYYFVSIVAFLLVLVQANAWFSLDVLRRPAIRRTHVPRWTVGVFRLQLGIVYFFAGVAKLNPDWLFRAMPLKIWLPAKAHWPLAGGLFKLKWVAFAFSWAGALYDLTVPFFLSWRKTRLFAYAAVVGFHVVTWMLFPIGMFPFIMILSTLVFFPAEAHRRAIEWLCRKVSSAVPEETAGGSALARPHRLVTGLLALHFALQVLLPFRHLAYPGDLFWHEQGFRFGWRVMLMEKAGYAIFRVRDDATGRFSEVSPGDYLTPNQEKMMATQPDMILQFAHFLAEEYRGQGIDAPAIYAEVYVTLNGSGSRLFTDPERDLAKEARGFVHKDWVLPFDPQHETLSMRSKQ